MESETSTIAKEGGSVIWLDRGMNKELIASTDESTIIAHCLFPIFLMVIIAGSPALVKSVLLGYLSKDYKSFYNTMQE